MNEPKIESHPIGVVKAIEGDQVVILFQRSAACAGCQACGLHKDTGEMMLSLPKDEEVQIGDKVGIMVKNEFFLKSAFLLYVVPLFVLIAVIGFGSLVFKSEMGQVILAIAGFALASGTYFALKLFKAKFKAMKQHNMGYYRVG